MTSTHRKLEMLALLALAAYFLFMPLGQEGMVITTLIGLLFFCFGIVALLLVFKALSSNRASINTFDILFCIIFISIISYVIYHDIIRPSYIIQQEGPLLQAIKN